MTDWLSFTQQQKRDPVLNDLTEEQVNAIIDILMLTIHADERVALMEKMHLEDLLRELPQTAGRQTTIETYTEQAAERIGALQGDKELRGVAEAAAQTLPGEQLREKVFRMAVTLAGADMELHETEQQTLRWVANAFGIDKDKRETILTETMDALLD